MSRLRRVPLSFRSVCNKWNEPESRPGDAVFANGDANVLRIVVVAAGVEHIELAVAFDRGRRFNALRFPWQDWLKNRAVVRLSPRVGA